MAPEKKETAGEISKKLGLADLARTRILARRLYLNSLARRASISYHDSLDILDPELELPLLPPRGYYLTTGGRNDYIASRRALPSVETRLMYNRRLAEMEAARLEAADKADRILDRYITRSKAKKTQAADDAGKTNEDDNNDTAGNNRGEVNDEDELTADDESFTEELESDYLDYVATPFDFEPPIRRLARRLCQRRLHPYAFRPIAVTTRTTERRLRDL